MTAFLRALIIVVCGLPVLLLVLHTILRIVRHFHKFPTPEFMAGILDNPLRRRFQPPDGIAVRHGLEPGMMVLEVGPGNGTYTMGIARRVGEAGKVVAIDIQPEIVQRLAQRAQAESVANLEARVADVYELPYPPGTFDAVTMIGVIGEIPDPDRAMQEFCRVLKPTGILADSELLPDPDYPLASTLIRRAAAAGFRLRKKIGGFFYYTLIFEKGK